VIIPLFIQTNEDIDPTSLVQAPTRLLLRRDSIIESSLVVWFWSSIVVPCDPTLALKALHMSSLLEYQEARSL
jgi:hypothetical protein